MGKDTKKCLCDEPQCAKCLCVGCQDKDCSVHTKNAKIRWQKNWEVGNNKSFPEPKNY